MTNKGEKTKFVSQIVGPLTVGVVAVRAVAARGDVLAQRQGTERVVARQGHVVEARDYLRRLRVYGVALPVLLLLLQLEAWKPIHVITLHTRTAYNSQPTPHRSPLEIRQLGL